jgi:hypothetical protein
MLKQEKPMTEREMDAKYSTQSPVGLLETWYGYDPSNGVLHNGAEAAKVDYVQYLGMIRSKRYKQYLDRTHRKCGAAYMHDR